MLKINDLSGIHQRSEVPKQNTTPKPKEAGTSRDKTSEIYIDKEEAAGAINLWETLNSNLMNCWRLNEH